MSGMERRDFVKATGAAAGAAGLAGCVGGGNGGGGDDDGPTVGIIEDRSGNFGLVGTPKWASTRLAIEEINEDGGILGEQIDIFDPDPQSDNTRYQELVEQAIQQQEVDALWAGYSSATREAIRPIITARTSYTSTRRSTRAASVTRASSPSVRPHASSSVSLSRT